MRRVSHPPQVRSFSVNKGLASRIPPAAGTHAIIFPKPGRVSPRLGRSLRMGAGIRLRHFPQFTGGWKGPTAQLEGPCSVYEAHPTLPTHLLPGSFSWFINI